MKNNVKMWKYENVEMGIYSTSQRHFQVYSIQLYFQKWLNIHFHISTLSHFHINTLFLKTL